MKKTTDNTRSRRTLYVEDEDAYLADSGRNFCLDNLSSCDDNLQLQVVDNGFIVPPATSNPEHFYKSGGGGGT